MTKSCQTCKHYSKEKCELPYHYVPQGKIYERFTDCKEYESNDKE